MRLLGLCPTVFTSVLLCAFGNVMLNSCPNHTLRVTEHQHSCRTTKDKLDEWGSGGAVDLDLEESGVAREKASSGARVRDSREIMETWLEATEMMESRKHPL